MGKYFRIGGLVTLALLVLALFFWIWKKTQPKEIIYQIETVKIGNVENTTVATGKLVPRNEVLVKPQISGIIAEILKEAGDFVKVGDVIATVQVVPDVAALNSAESRVQLAQISLNQIKMEYERQKDLFEKGVIAKEEMDKSDADYKKAVEELGSSRDNLDIVKTGISKKTAKYSNTQIRATIEGMILDVPIKVGNSVIQANTFNDGTTIASIANMNDLIFEGKIDETEVGRIHAGMKIKLSLGALTDKKFDAELEYVAPKGTEENGAVMFEIKAAAHVPADILVRAGYSSNAEIQLAKADSVLTIPEGCVEFSNDSAYIYTVKAETPKQEFEKKHIKTGLSDGIKIEIKSGLKKGDKVRGGVVVEEERYKPGQN